MRTAPELAGAVFVWHRRSRPHHSATVAYLITSQKITSGMSVSTPSPDYGIDLTLNDIVTVDEEEIANAILLLLEREKTLAEGAGAAAIAALLNHKLPLAGKKIAVLVGGGNIDVTLLSRIIERGLVKDGRLVRLRVHLPDYPGALHNLTGILAQHRANIVETSYDRAYYGVNLGDTAIDITMETRGPDHIAELLSALGASGYAHERVL